MGTYTKAQLEAELTRIKNAVASCRTAIYNKGVTSIPANPTLSQLATYANLIECSHPDILLKWLGNGTSYSATRADVYFDTGLYPDTNTSFDAVFSRPVTGGDAMLFGTDDSTSYSFFFIPYYSSGYSWWFSNAYVSSGTWRPTGTPTNVGSFVHLGFVRNPYATSNYGYLSVGTGSWTKALSSTTTTARYTITLFARNKGTSVDCKAYNGTRIKYIKFINSNTGKLLRFYIPVLHWNNGAYVPCFYDKVNDSYIYNLGTGTVSYESYGYKVCDSIYYNTRVTNTSYGFLTDAPYGVGDANFVKASAETFAGEQFLLGWRKPTDGNYKFGLCIATSNAYMYYPKSNGCGGSNSNKAFTSGTRMDVAGLRTGSANYRRLYAGGTTVTSSTEEATNTSVSGQKYFILGNNGSIYPNTKVYYAAVNNNVYTTAYNYIPILDGTTPKFIELERGTLISYNGSASAVSYDLLD